MSIESVALVLHHSAATGTAKVVMLGIANHDGDGGAWPAMATLAKYANVTEKAARQAVRRLEVAGEIRVWVQDGGNRDCPDHMRPNRYDVLVSCPPTCDGTKNHRPRKLPTSAADLWIEPLPSAGAPPVSGRRALPLTGGEPLPSAGGEPSLEPPTHQERASVTGPREELAICDVCSLPGAQCLARASHSGHNYQPRTRDPRRVLALVRDEYSS